MFGTLLDIADSNGCQTSYTKVIRPNVIFFLLELNSDFSVGLLKWKLLIEIM